MSKRCRLAHTAQSKNNLPRAPSRVSPFWLATSSRRTPGITHKTLVYSLFYGVQGVEIQVLCPDIPIRTENPLELGSMQVVTLLAGDYSYSARPRTRITVPSLLKLDASST